MRSSDFSNSVHFFSLVHRFSITSSSLNLMSRNMKIFAIGVATTVVVAAIIAICVHSTSSDSVHPPSEAICVINGGPKTLTISGIIRLHQDNMGTPVILNGTITGLSPHKHGFHVHESGDFSNPDNACVSTGPHFNPYHKTHGGPHSDIRHVGDLGNIVADADGEADIQKSDPLISLIPGSPNSILGRAIVVHELEDDEGTDGKDSLNTGNAGSRLGCCIIGRINQKTA